MQTAQQMLNSPLLLMEGALGERLKREYQLAIDGVAGMAHLIETSEGRAALRAIWLQYADIARRYRLPFVATTPTRRASHNRIRLAGLPETILKDNLRFLQRQSRKQPQLIGGFRFGANLRKPQRQQHRQQNDQHDAKYSQRLTWRAMIHFRFLSMRYALIKVSCPDDSAYCDMNGASQQPTL